MIFYYTGTGNSLQAAKSLAEYNGERLVSIAALMNKGEGSFEFILGEDETIGFVYPVYSWAPPETVLEFIDRLVLKNYKDNFTFSVAVCGDTIGHTMKVLSKRLNGRNLKLDSGFSLQMPNNYIIMFDVDDKEREKAKLDAAEAALANINRLVGERSKGVFQLVKGITPGIFTYVINPLFNWKGRDPRKFYAEDSCNGCGICEKICNCSNIKVMGKPQWGSKCSQCLACIHHCPVKAIQYGKSTIKKGRYINPNVSVIEAQDII